VRLNAGLASEGRERRCLCLLGIEGELTLVDRLRVELLGAGEGGVVGERGEIAADDEGVPDVDGGAEHHQQRQRQQQPGDQHRAALVAQPSRRGVHGELSPMRLAVGVDGGGGTALDGDRAELADERQRCESELRARLRLQDGAASEGAVELQPQRNTGLCLCADAIRRAA